MSVDMRQIREGYFSKLTSTSTNACYDCIELACHYYTANTINAGISVVIDNGNAAQKSKR